MNSRVTIITGGRQSGKTRLAKEMAEGRNSVMFDGRQFPKSREYRGFYFGGCTEDTEVIILDDCKFSPELIERIIPLNIEGFMSERRCKDPIYVNPEIITTIYSEDTEKANKYIDNMLSVSLAAQRRINLVKL